jgi:RNA polymerase sigma factor (sigma-70 family)
MVLKDHDILLVKGLIKGHMASFNAVYNKYHNAVYANILKYVQSKAQAEDILQEVFLSLWENRQNLRENGSVGGWLFVVSHNKSLAFLRKALTEKKAFSALPQVETACANWREKPIMKQPVYWIFLLPL